MNVCTHDTGRQRAVLTISVHDSLAAAAWRMAAASASTSLAESHPMEPIVHAAYPTGWHNDEIDVVLCSLCNLSVPSACRCGACGAARYGVQRRREAAWNHSARHVTALANKRGGSIEHNTQSHAHK